MHKLTLFFSWQSDVEGNHSNIQKSLIHVCNNLRENKLFDIEYDESTSGMSGSPEISSSVLTKIQNCDMFVADLTPVVSTDNKLFPNSNVMLELGVAKASISDAVILLLYTGEVETSKMPFDINHQRLSKFPATELETFIRMMAESAVKNPRISSKFDKNDRYLHYDLNVRKNKTSGKYLPNVFIENMNVKQHLRDFVAPQLFTKYVLERCSVLNFDALNRKRQMKGMPQFVLDVSNFYDCPAEENIGKFYEKTIAFRDYLLNSYNGLYKESNRSYSSSNKIGRQIEHLKYITSKLLVITSKAGQGKTNLICDLVDKVLLKRGIPFVYLNGYEIDPNDIGNSFAAFMLPNTNIAFDEVIRDVDIYCKYKRCPIILIIDGLNENPLPSVFARKLELFLDSVLQYDCVKVVMSCRTEYYDEHFKSFDSLFEHTIVKLENINHHLQDDENQRLIKNYFQYYSIQGSVSDNICNQFGENLLLLRIFCEANKGKNVGHVYHIRREELFFEYYIVMCDNLVDKVLKEENRKLDKNRITSFIRNIVKYMVDNDVYFNVPIEYIFSTLSSEEERSIFNRFLDENILLRKDLAPESKGAFSHLEVVNFTYDAYRDYLLSSYLIDCIAKTDNDKFLNLVNLYANGKHQLKEGILPFLFLHSRSIKDDAVVKIIKSMAWYEDVFSAYIWDLQEVMIDDADITLVKKLMTESPEHFIPHLIFWRRWDSNQYSKLNICLVIDYLLSLDDAGLYDILQKTWPDNIMIARKHNQEMERMIMSLKEALNDESILNNSESKNLFELLLFMVPFSGQSAEQACLDYLRQTHNYQLLDEVQAKTNSMSLSRSIIKLKKAII